MSDCYCILKCGLVEETGGNASGDEHETRSVYMYIPRGSEYRADPLKFITKHNNIILVL